MGKIGRQQPDRSLAKNKASGFQTSVVLIWNKFSFYIKPED